MVHHVLDVERGSVKRSMQRWAHGIIAKNADVAFCYATEAGDRVAAELTSFGMDPSRISRVHNGYDGAEIDRIGPTSSRYDACLVGGLRPGKGLGEIVPIWEAVCKHRPFRLAIVGGILDANKKILEQEITRAGLTKHISLLGPLSHTDAIAVVKSSSMMVAPSLEEGWGIAVCESLACGVPVVAYDLPAYRSLFNDGMLRAPIGNRESFAKLVCRLLDDAQFRNELKKRAPNAVAAYEWNTVASTDAQLMESLVP